MKILSKDFYVLANNEEITIDDIRKHLIKWMLVLLILLGSSAVIIGIIEAIELKQTFAAIIYFSLFAPIFLAFFFQKHISYWFTVSLILFSGFLIGVLNIVLYGFSGAGLPIFYTIAVLSTVFLGMRAGFITLITCSIPMIIIAYLMTNNLLSLSVDLEEISKSPISWISAICIMVFLGSLMIFGYGIIQKNLLITLKLVRKQANDVQAANQQLLKSQEETEAYNEELRSTTDTLIDNNKQLELAKEKAEESDRLKTEFINNMSHEIRTPMNGILGFSRMLDKPDLSKEKRRLYIDIVKNSGDQLLNIIEDLLEISKLETEQVKLQNDEVCINHLLSDLLSNYKIKAQENNIPLYLKKSLPDKGSKFFTDETKLNKILNNLLENSLKFTSEGFIEFGYRLINNDIEIYIKDIGVGISVNKQKAIFERFSQEEQGVSRSFGGLGLGLSIAKKNVELLGGKITLESEKGKGATFYVTIPYKPVNSKYEYANVEIEINKTSKQQNTDIILIVEDEEVNYLYFEALLEDEYELNCKILQAKDGNEAIEICRKTKGIDIVFMDIKMPIMDGYEAAKQIKEFKPDLPIIAQTAYTSKEDKNKAIAAGCNDFITKPINKKDFTNIIEKYLIAK